MKCEHVFKYMGERKEKRENSEGRNYYVYYDRFFCEKCLERVEKKSRVGHLFN